MRGLMMTLLLAAAPGVVQDDNPKASEGWVRLPADGETSASAFAVVRNPGMYDVYLVSASSELAGDVELHAGDDVAKELVVPAYGKLAMTPDGPHVVLVGLKRPLEEGASVVFTLVTDSSVKLRVTAVVRAD